MSQTTPNGALATTGPTIVRFNTHLNSAGAIDLLAADGTELISQVTQLAYLDARTGKHLPIAHVKDSVGVLYPPNQVVYPDAFMAQNGSGKKSRPLWARATSGSHAVSGSTDHMRVAAAPYNPQGLVLDYITVPSSANSYTFQSGETYYVPNDLYQGPGTATFEPGCVIKLNTGSWLMTYGSVYFPPSDEPPAIITSKDDNTSGTSIGTSTGLPGYTASRDLWLYYNPGMTAVRDVQLRWAQRALQYDENPGLSLHPTLSYTALQNCSTGLYLNLANDSLSLSHVTKGNVVTPVYDQSGSYSGSITTDCGAVNASKTSLSQAEPAIAVRGQHGVIVSMNPEVGANGGRSLLKMLSTDGGATWTATRIADGYDSMVQAWSDPALESLKPKSRCEQIKF